MYEIITEESIKHLVHRFYAGIRSDEKLAPIFETAIGITDEEWTSHLEKISLFWSSIMLGAKGYEGKPLQAHKDLPAFEARLFSRWLALFANTAIETHDIVSATAFIRKAVSIANMMSRDLYDSDIEMPPMSQLPSHMKHYHTTPVFFAANIPDALRKAHRTGEGVFGKIVVAKGSLLYTIGKKQCHVLTSEVSGVIEPKALHFVTPLDNTEFVVEFYKDHLSLPKGTSSS